MAERGDLCQGQKLSEQERPCPDHSGCIGWGLFQCKDCVKNCFLILKLRLSGLFKRAQTQNQNKTNNPQETAQPLIEKTIIENKIVKQTQSVSTFEENHMEMPHVIMHTSYQYKERSDELGIKLGGIKTESGKVKSTFKDENTSFEGNASILETQSQPTEKSKMLSHLETFTFTGNDQDLNKNNRNTTSLLITTKSTSTLKFDHEFVNFERSSIHETPLTTKAVSKPPTPPPLPSEVLTMNEFSSSIRKDKLNPQQMLKCHMEGRRNILTKDPVIGSYRKTKVPREENDKEELKGIFWNVLPDSRLDGTVWGEMGDEASVDLKPYFRILQERFRKTKNNALQNRGNTSELKSFKKNKLLSQQRGQNIEIALASFKYNVKDIKNAIIRLDRRVLDVDTIQKLIGLLPSKQEREIINRLREIPKDLSVAEGFVLEMNAIPRLETRLRCIMFENDFDETLLKLQNIVDIMRKAFGFILESESFRKLLHLVLLTGNYLNDSNRLRRRAIGIELCSGLKKFSESKSNNGSGSYSLLHWLAHVISERKPELFKIFHESDILQIASSFDVKAIDEEVSKLQMGKQTLFRELMCARESPNEPSNSNFLRVFNEVTQLRIANGIEMIQMEQKVLKEKLQLVLKRFGELSSNCDGTNLILTCNNFIKGLKAAQRENNQIPEHK